MASTTVARLDHPRFVDSSGSDEYLRVEFSLNPRVSDIDDRLKRLEVLWDGYLAGLVTEETKIPVRHHLLELKNRVREARIRLESLRLYRTRLRPPARFAQIMAEVHMSQLPGDGFDDESGSGWVRATGIHVELSEESRERSLQFA